MSLLGLGAGDIRQSLEMEVEHAELDRTFDQPRRLVDKLLLVRNKSEQHADRHVAGECRLRAEIDDQDILQTEYRVIGDSEGLFEKAGRSLGLNDLRHSGSSRRHSARIRG